MHPKSHLLSSAVFRLYNQQKYVFLCWHNDEKKILSSLSFLFVWTFTHLHFSCPCVELIYQTLLKAGWQKCNNIFGLTKMSSSLYLFIFWVKKHWNFSQQDSVLKTIAPLQITAWVKDDNCCKPECMPGRNHFNSHYQGDDTFVAFQPNVLSHVRECTLLCSAISGVRYSQFALLLHLIECVTIHVLVYIGIFCSSRSLNSISHYITVNFLLFCH